MQLPSQPPPGLAEVIEELIDRDPRAVRLRCGVPHPLSKVAGPNFVDGFFADIVLEFIHDTVWEEPESNAHKGATWFLLASEQAYYFACGEAGIDAERLRRHLRKHCHKSRVTAEVDAASNSGRVPLAMIDRSSMVSGRSQHTYKERYGLRVIGVIATLKIGGK